MIRNASGACIRHAFSVVATLVFTFQTTLTAADPGSLVERKPGQVADVVVGKSLKMKFCWVPAGKATLGSRNGFDENREHQYSTDGLWMGKYTVTQKEWQTIMGNNPSCHSKDGGDKHKVVSIDTALFPVETISWDDCQDFITKFRSIANVPTVMGSGKFALPDEDQWEYACRGGLGKQQFYWGNELNGDKANCNGRFPAAMAEGTYLGRTTLVGSYESKAPHPWGLCDMSGNVWQWCNNVYAAGSTKHALRGGGYFTPATSCVSVRRSSAEPTHSCSDTGFRLVYVP